MDNYPWEALHPQYRLYPLVKAVPQLSYRVCFFHLKHLLKHDLVDNTLTVRVGDDERRRLKSVVVMMVGILANLS